MEDKSRLFSLVLIDLPLFLFAIYAPLSILLLCLWVYCSKLLQKRKIKCLSILFNEINPKWMDFYARYRLSFNLSMGTSVFAFSTIVLYVVWMPFWIMSHDILQEMAGYTWRLSVIHATCCLFAITYWSYFLINVVNLEKIKREIKSKTLIFNKNLKEHKIFGLLPCDTPIAKMQASWYKRLWIKIKKKIGDNEKITGKTLLRFFITNNLTIDALAPQLVLNAKQLNLNINPMQGYWYLGAGNMTFKDAEEKRLTPHEVLEITRDYFASMSFTQT